MKRFLIYTALTALGISVGFTLGAERAHAWSSRDGTIGPTITIDRPSSNNDQPRSPLALRQMREVAEFVAAIGEPNA